MVKLTNRKLKGCSSTYQFVDLIRYFDPIVFLLSALYMCKAFSLLVKYNTYAAC